MKIVRKMSVTGKDEMMMEDLVDDPDCQPQNAVVYLSSNDKQIFLRIISAERNFIKSEFIVRVGSQSIATTD